MFMPGRAVPPFAMLTLACDDSHIDEADSLDQKPLHSAHLVVELPFDCLSNLRYCLPFVFELSDAFSCFATSLFEFKFVTNILVFADLEFDSWGLGFRV